MRLDRYLSYVQNLTRSEAKRVIRQGLVKVNDETVTRTDFHVQEDDRIAYQDELCKYRDYLYFMLNKPRGYLSSTRDKERPTVLDLIKGYEKYELFMAGRLDFDSEGLMIITNDGELAHRLMSPRYECPKTYYVQVEGEFVTADIRSFSEGLLLEDGSGEKYFTKPAALEILSATEALITIHEGKYHQVKRMCEKLGKKVIYLKRNKIGDLELGSNLLPGQYRELLPEEIAILKK
jgi:16S rRNA pseudouridine516 synthase